MRLALAISLGVAAPATALDLADCERLTHPSHGGEEAHRDFGAARVGWEDWWSQEGVYRDLVVADCKAGTYLKTRTHEERIGARLPFERTEKARQIIDTELAASPSLFSFQRLADALHPTGRDIEIAALEAEPCACAVLYPEHRGERTPYEVMQ